MSCCTSDVRLQVLSFIEIMHLGSIHRFQRFSCYHFVVVDKLLPQFLSE